MNLGLVGIVAGLLAMNVLNADATQGIPRPEHPRPDMERAEWLNLNGSWEFAETDDSKDTSFLTKSNYPDKILVPFCRESELSGLNRKGFVKNVWYRRNFARPKNWKTSRTILHIGACDWLTTVWVNGHQVGQHTGGSVAFGFEITQYLKPGDNTVIVHAFDDTKSGLQALGKQCTEEKSFGCLYTRTTGIWQTVWLEGVGSSYLNGVRIEPDVAGSQFLITAEVTNALPGQKVHAVVKADGKTVAEAETTADWRNGKMVIPISKPRLWSIEDPFLYDVELSVRQNGKTVDTLKTYAGMRSITIDGHAILINGKPVFQRLVLDQGFYPDGIWTAPSAEALKHDIELSMAAGFNGARLHQKVFEPRFLYLADKMGYLVWGEFPNWGLNYADPRINLPVLDEWNEIVRRDRNHPSLVGWCPFNESANEAGPIQNATVALTRQLDPSRPIIDSSGWTHTVANPEVLDAHDYDQNPATFRDRWMRYFQGDGLPPQYGQKPKVGVPFMVSEYGGIGWATGEGWGYGNSPKTLEEFYTRFEGLGDALLDNPNMFGFCYTQLTDVEQERNGIYTYDRKPKFDVKKLHAALSKKAAFEKGVSASTNKAMTWTTVVGSARDGSLAKDWQYTTEKPAEDWFKPEFNSTSWKSAPGGFGNKDNAEKTKWTTSDIWLRQSFDYEPITFERGLIAIHYDNAAQIYINGALVWAAEEGTWNDGYDGMEVTAALRKALKKGKNVIAVHCHQNDGGQFIDLGILLGSSGNKE